MEILRSVASTSSNALNTVVSASAPIKKRTFSKDDTESLRRTVTMEEDEEVERIRRQALGRTTSSGLGDSTRTSNSFSGNETRRREKEEEGSLCGHQQKRSNDDHHRRENEQRGSFCGQTACVSLDSFSSYDDDGALLPFDRDGAPHSWSSCSAGNFKVRSKTYLHDKRKVESGAYLFPARGAELLLTQTCPENVGSNDKLFNGTIRDVPSFIVNFRFPWGVLVLAFEVPTKLVPFLEYRNAKGSAKRPQPSIPKSFAPAEKRAARFLMSSDVDISSSLKLIPVATDGPWLVRNLVTGTPVIIGNKVRTRVFRAAGDVLPKSNHASNHDDNESCSHSTDAESRPRNTDTGSDGSDSSCSIKRTDSGGSGVSSAATSRNDKRRAPYLELDLDIGESIKPRAKKIVSMCRTHMTSLNCNIGFVVQSDTADELPEQMLAGLSLNRIDPNSAPLYPSPCDRAPPSPTRSAQSQ